MLGNNTTVIRTIHIVVNELFGFNSAIFYFRCYYSIPETNMLFTNVLYKSSVRNAISFFQMALSAFLLSHY